MGETPHSPVALYEAAHLLGTLIAKTILASVHVRARKKAGHMGASDLIKALQNLARRGPFSNRSSPVRIPVYIARPGHGSLRGQRGLPQHLVRSGGQALQGPQRAYVDTRPPARRAIACTLALGRCLLAYLTSFDELRCHGRRGPAEWLARSPDTVQDHGQLARQGDPCFA